MDGSRILILCILQCSSHLVFFSEENKPVASTGQFIEVPFLPHHIYALYPAEVLYSEKMPRGFDSKYPFIGDIEYPIIATNSVSSASRPGKSNASTNNKKVSETEEFSNFWFT